MTLAEFKAWFEGFTESMDAAPSKKQWERIKEKVATLGGIQGSRIYPQIGGSLLGSQAELQDIYANPRYTAASDRFPLETKSFEIS